MPSSPDERPGGFIVLHRRMLSWPLWGQMDIAHRHVWLHLLFAANWKNSEVWTRKGRLIVQRGQALIALRTLAEQAGVSLQNVRTAIALLTREGAIQVTQVPTYRSRTASLITVVNYDLYQDVKEREDFDAQPAQHKPHTIRTRGTSSSLSPNDLKTVPPSDSRGGGRVIRLNPDDVLSDWDHELQRHVPRGLTAHGRDALRRGKP